MKYPRELIVSVKEMFVERHWHLVDIASRLGIDPQDVQAIIDLINNVAT